MTWLKFLPEPFQTNPSVIVVMAPLTAATTSIKRDAYEMTVLVVDGRQEGLQVTSPRMPRYPDHFRVFTNYSIRMARPEYHGPIADIPDHLLTSDGVPLVFQRDAFFKQYIHLRRVIARATKQKGHHVQG